MTRHVPRRIRRAYTLAVPRAYTLVEMLIVMTIMLMLVVVALPAVKRVMEDGNVREASRQLNSYFAMAKARALHTGRPCGVMMICEPVAGIADPTAATGNIPHWPTRQVTKFYLAEIPPPYSGGVIGAKGRIMATTLTAAPNLTYEFIPLTGTGALDTSEQAMVRSLLTDGERFFVRFDFHGAWYACSYLLDNQQNPHFVYQSPGGSGVPAVGVVIPPSTTPVGVTSINSTAPLPPAMPLATHSGFPYQIIRLPRRIGSPLELSGGTAIDIAYCGIGPRNQQFSSSLLWGMYPTDGSTNTPTAPAGLFPMAPGRAPVLENLTVMFTPGGGIDSIYLNNYSFMPDTTVHFLIGRGDKLNDPFGSSAATPIGMAMFDPALSNLADPNSLWVSVSRSTGNVGTSDNLPPPISAASGTSAILYSGSTLQQQTINPSKAAGQVSYLSFCRQLATNREQVRGQ